MKDILIIFTGGTIGSIEKNGIIAPDESAKAELLEGYEREYGGRERFEIMSPFSILSENVSASELAALCRLVEEYNKSYKGIIITYGSDTLSFATAFLGMAFKDRLQCPVVFVAANKPLSDRESNGFLNFSGAVWLIDYLSRSGFYNDVYAVWHDGSAFNAYRGVELTEADAGSHNHSVFGGEPFAEFYPEGLNNTGDGYIWRTVINDKHEDRCGGYPDEERRETFAKKGFEADEDRVAAIRMYPGINFDRIGLEGVKAVLAYGYHSGTFPCGEGAKNFYAFADRLKELGIRLYAAPFKRDATAVYESAKDMGEFVIRLEEMSFEAAYAYVLVCEGGVTIQR